MKKTQNFAEAVRSKLAADPQLADLVEQESLNADVAEMIYEARTAAGLTQAELAAMVGTRQSVIARLEAADYGGHSLNMLRRIATALNQRVRVEFYTPGIPPIGKAAQTD